MKRRSLASQSLKSYQEEKLMQADPDKINACSYLKNQLSTMAEKMAGYGYNAVRVACVEDAHVGKRLGVSTDGTK